MSKKQPIVHVNATLSGDYVRINFLNGHVFSNEYNPLIGFVLRGNWFAPILPPSGGGARKLACRGYDDEIKEEVTLYIEEGAHYSKTGFTERMTLLGKAVHQYKKMRKIEGDDSVTEDFIF